MCGAAGSVGTEITDAGNVDRKKSSGTRAAVLPEKVLAGTGPPGEKNLKERTVASGGDSKSHLNPVYSSVIADGKTPLCSAVPGGVVEAAVHTTTSCEKAPIQTNDARVHHVLVTGESLLRLTDIFARFQEEVGDFLPVAGECGSDSTMDALRAKCLHAEASYRVMSSMFEKNKKALANTSEALEVSEAGRSEAEQRLLDVTKLLAVAGEGAVNEKAAGERTMRKLMETTMENERLSFELALERNKVEGLEQKHERAVVENARVVLAASAAQMKTQEFAQKVKRHLAEIGRNHERQHKIAKLIGDMQEQFKGR